MKTFQLSKVTQSWSRNQIKGTSPTYHDFNEAAIWLRERHRDKKATNECSRITAKKELHVWLLSTRNRLKQIGSLLSFLRTFYCQRDPEPRPKNKPKPLLTISMLNIFQPLNLHHQGAKEPAGDASQCPAQESTVFLHQPDDHPIWDHPTLGWSEEQTVSLESMTSHSTEDFTSLPHLIFPSYPVHRCRK